MGLDHTWNRINDDTLVLEVAGIPSYVYSTSEDADEVLEAVVTSYDGAFESDDLDTFVEGEDDSPPAPPAEFTADVDVYFARIWPED